MAKHKMRLPPVHPGEVLREDQLFDTFRYKFDVPPTGEQGSQQIALVVERSEDPSTTSAVAFQLTQTAGV